MLIDINTNTAVNLAPHLKEAQLEVMTNGDEYVPILPNFTGCGSLMDVLHLKSQLTSLELKACHKTPNYLASSSCKWPLTQAATIAMTPFYQKEQFTYLAHKCTNKF